MFTNTSKGTGNINGGLGAMLCQTDEEGEDRVISYKNMFGIIQGYQVYPISIIIQLQW
jgi:hypothetical protein